MKFKGTISRIDEQGVKAISDNPIKKPKYLIVGSSLEYFLDRFSPWKEAEAQRKEYDIGGLGNFPHAWGVPVKKANRVIYWITLFEGMRIEGEIINNEIVNVKIV